MTARVLVVAGEDSAGLAGLSADLKTLSLFGIDAETITTAKTRQKGTEFYSTNLVAVEEIKKNLSWVFKKNTPAVVKTGMLGSAAVVEALAFLLKALPASRRPLLVVDPVMQSTSGGELLDAAGQQCLKEKLLPLATVLTPNADEAAALCGAEAPLNEKELLILGRRLLSLGAENVYLKAGHLAGNQCQDFFLSEKGQTALEAVPKKKGGPFRGTGCTLASALAAGLALGLNAEDAAKQAQCFTAAAIRHAQRHQNFSSLGHEEAARELNF